LHFCEFSFECILFWNSVQLINGTWVFCANPDHVDTPATRVSSHKLPMLNQKIPICSIIRGRKYPKRKNELLLLRLLVVLLLLQMFTHRMYGILNGWKYKSFFPHRQVIRQSSALKLPPWATIPDCNPIVHLFNYFFALHHSTTKIMEEMWWQKINQRVRIDCCEIHREKSHPAQVAIASVGRMHTQLLSAKAIVPNGHLYTNRPNGCQMFQRDVMILCALLCTDQKFFNHRHNSFKVGLQKYFQKIDI
jgi:hypothetical protein